MVIQYKCPECGSNMLFDAASGKLKCESCDTKFEIENASFEGEIQTVEECKEEATYMDPGEVREYHCQNCGAVILCNPNTTATKCSFCDSPVVLQDRLDGVLAPQLVLPFEINKETALTSFKEWCKKAVYSPLSFRQQLRIKELEGIYVPFWFYDIAGQGEVLMEGTISTTHREGNYEVTITKHYDVYRRLDLRYNRIPEDASQRMDDHLMDLLEPFKNEKLTAFNNQYFAGYVAEKYDYTADEMFDRAKKKVENFMDTYVKGTASQYSTVRIKNKAYQLTKTKVDYTMVPVWMMYIKQDDKDYTFAMNGQTGKISGVPPVSVKVCLGKIGLYSVIIFILLRLITVLLGGPVL